jgi:hypothetical protein
VVITAATGKQSATSNGHRAGNDEVLRPLDAGRRDGYLPRPRH